MPVEHGSWSWLLVPFGVGAGVAGRFDLPVLLTALAGLSAFLVRQPASVWMRVRRGRARRAHGPLAAGWTAAFGSLSLLCLIGLLLLDRAQLLMLALPLIGIFAMYLVAARQGGAGLRTLWMELTGAAALALMAPAAFVAAVGQYTLQAWLLWIVMVIQNILGALYVRLRIFDTHHQPIRRSMIGVVHLIGLAIVVALGLFAPVPWPVALPFGLFFIRSLWAVLRPRPVTNIKRFGFTEMGIEIVSGIWIVLSYTI